MMRATQLIAVLVALSLVVGSVPAAAVASTATTGAAQTAQLQTNSTETNQSGTNQSASVRASTGQQLSTVLAVTDDEVKSAVEESSVEALFAAAAETERAELIASRGSTLRERAAGLVADRRAATAAYENGTLSTADYAQRVAVLSGQAATVSNAITRVQQRAVTVSASELEAAGYDAAAVADTQDRLQSLTGASSRALLDQYTGVSNGEIRIERAGGVEIEVESEDGEQSRSFERPQPGDGSFVVSMDRAQVTAEAALSTDRDGEWTLEEAKRKTEYGFYEFEFVFEGPTRTGEAEVDVDGQTGEIFAFEEELEPRDDDDEEPEDNTRLLISVVDGEPAPGATVTLQVTATGDPVSGVDVEVGDSVVGTTDDDGRLTVTLPDDEEVDIEVEDGERDGELELEFADEEDEESEDEESQESEDEEGEEREDEESQESEDEEGEEREDEESQESEDEEGEEREDEENETDEQDESEAETEAEDEIATADGDLAISVVSGDPAPDATVTLEVSQGGQLVADATVTVNGEQVGSTNGNGQLTVTFPDDEDVEISVESGDSDGDRDFEFDTDESDEEDA